jgi:hypothetical protein
MTIVTAWITLGARQRDGSTFRPGVHLGGSATSICGGISVSYSEIGERGTLLAVRIAYGESNLELSIVRTTDCRVSDRIVTETTGSGGVDVGFF